MVASQSRHLAFKRNNFKGVIDRAVEASNSVKLLLYRKVNVVKFMKI